MVAARAEAAGGVVTRAMLLDLAHLFVLEGELTADDDEADRLGTIAQELEERAEQVADEHARFRAYVMSGAWHADDSNGAWGMC